MADDKKIDSGEIENAEERVKEIFQMGKGLGFKFPEWYVILKMATIKMEAAFAAKGQSITIIGEMSCDCEKCRKARENQERRAGFHVVPN